MTMEYAAMGSPLDLLRLPDVVKTLLCQFLDVDSLMNLRLTCKGLKAAVEQPSVLELFPIKISTGRQLRKVVESAVVFNNFILNFKSLEDQTHLRKFAEKFGAQMRKLCILTLGGEFQALMLLTKCTHLKQLEIKEVDVIAFTNKDYLNTFLKNIQSLRKLTIHQLKGNQSTGYKEITFFHTILNNCKHLVEFEIPAINSYKEKLTIRQRKDFQEDQVQNPNPPNNDDEENWEQEDVQDDYDPLPEWDLGNTRDILIHPVLDYIRSKITTDFPKVKYINVENLNSFEWNTFKALVDVCNEHGVYLRGIHTLQFFDIKDEISFLDSKYNHLIQSVSMTNIHEGFPFFMISNITQLKVQYCNITGKCFSGLEASSDLTLPHLQDLTVQFILGVHDTHSRLFVRKLFKDYKRCTMRKLELQFCNDGTCTMISAMDLATNFRYIKELEIHEWCAVDEDFCLLWTNLSELEKLTVENCRNITNKAFVGNFNLKDDRNIHLRPLNRLKKLRSLTIRDITGDVNEEAILGSFRWIKLVRFEFYSTEINEIREEVYRRLLTAPLGKSVEYFVLPEPSSESTFFNKRVLFQGFKNLKRCAFW